jgi:hypothetical protein
VDQVVKCLLHKCEALSSNSRTTKKYVLAYIPDKGLLSLTYKELFQKIKKKDCRESGSSGRLLA